MMKSNQDTLDKLALSIREKKLSLKLLKFEEDKLREIINDMEERHRLLSEGQTEFKFVTQF